VLHIGGDGTGTHSGFDELLNVEVSNRRINVIEKRVEQDESAFTAFSKVLKKQHKPPIVYRIKRKIKNLLR
jgi:hypothetical protein